MLLSSTNPTTPPHITLSNCNHANIFNRFESRLNQTTKSKKTSYNRANLFTELKSKLNQTLQIKKHNHFNLESKLNTKLTDHNLITRLESKLNQITRTIKRNHNHANLITKHESKLNQITQAKLTNYNHAKRITQNKSKLNQITQSKLTNYNRANPITRPESKLNQITETNKHNHNHANILTRLESKLNQITETNKHNHDNLLTIHSAFRLFSETRTGTRTTFIWNTLIRACAHSQTHKDLAFFLYYNMLLEGQVTPDKHTFPFVLKGCAYLFDEFGGKQCHAHVFKYGFWSDVYVSNSLMHFYSSCGRVDYARKVFDEMPERSVVSWNVLIDGFVRGGDFDEGLGLFRRMRVEGFAPDEYTLQSVVTGCGGLGTVSLGMWVHRYVLRGFDREVWGGVLLGNALVEMYCKCGMLDMGKQVFNRMVKRDINTWNLMILGFASHGLYELALECFDEMSKVEGLKPNSITFVGILSACNHGGMVELGREYFNKMVEDYSIEPRLEHYGCLVDLLARAGGVYEALDLVSSMPMKPDTVIWRSILDACCKQNIGLELSEEVAKKILESDEVVSSGVYVLLSRVYASAARWDDVGLIRQLMADMGIKKEPGCSSLEINGVNHEFFAGDTTHPETKDIYRVLEVINKRLNSVGYKPDVSQAALVEDEDENHKKDALRLHSERLAIAYGIMHLDHGVPIRIFKNLRVCNDCHQVTKLISKLFDVEIIVRDRARFHRFKDGCCSCSDYW